MPHVIVVTQARVLCLICTHKPKGAQHPRASVDIRIRQTTSACVTTNNLCYTSGNAAVFLSPHIHSSVATSRLTIVNREAKKKQPYATNE